MLNIQRLTRVSYVCVSKAYITSEGVCAVIIDDYMTKNPETLHPDDPISYALNKMHVFGIRHIPIIEESGATRGLISVKDIIAHIGNYFGEEIVNLPPEPARKALHRPEGG